MKKNKVKSKEAALELISNDMKSIIKEYNIPHITQREYFGLSGVTEFFMRKWGLNFSEVKKSLGMENNTGGKKVATVVIETEHNDNYENSIRRYYNPPKLTGKTKNCLKCECQFPQSNYNYHICEKCSEENRDEYDAVDYHVCHA